VRLLEKNVEKVFEKCIYKVLPSRLREAGHKRTKTTAVVTAPIWLRQIVDGFVDSDEDVSITRKDSLGDDDPYVLLDDDGSALDPLYD